MSTSDPQLSGQEACGKDGTCSGKLVQAENINVAQADQIAIICPRHKQALPTPIPFVIVIAMVRPRGSFQNRLLALEFAEIVTVADANMKSKVARAGKFSVFEVFARCCPWAVRFTDQGPLDGLSLSEFNKLLESHGFLKVRKSPPNKDADPSQNFADPSNPDYTGAYAFAKLRWRDPTDAEDAAALREGRMGMQALFCNNSHRIVDEEEFMRRVLEAKLEGDGQTLPSRTSTPIADHNPNANPEPAQRKRRCSDAEEDCGHKRQKSRACVSVECFSDDEERLESVASNAPLWDIFALSSPAHAFQHSCPILEVANSADLRAPTLHMMAECC